MEALHDGHEWMEVLLRRAHSHVEAVSERVITRVNCHAHVEISLHLHLVQLLLSRVVAEEVMACRRRLIVYARIALEVLLLLPE